MDLKVAGVDIILLKGPLLLEVNSSLVDRRNRLTNKDMSPEMIKAIEKNFKLKITTWRFHSNQ
jgi:glutathione synthase/RimK-type ligase-like ATP-grasp enzyme